IAFLHVKNKKLPAISMGSSAGLAPGSWVCALGISPESQIQVTQGIVSSVTADRFRLNITITPGMSGGPVLNEKGQLIGLLRGVYAGDRSYFPGPRQTPPLGYPFEQMETPPLGMAMAIPVEMLNDIFKEIKTKGKVERGWLGVSIREDADQRVIISEVEDESPASLARIQPGDRVLKINGKEIKNADQFASEIRRHHPGQQITLTIDRQGKMLEIEARLGNLPEEEAFRELELRFPDIFRQFPRDLPLTPRPGGQSFEFGVQNYGFLGIFLEQLTPELSKYFGVPEGRGLLVARLIPGGPAEKAGLKIGDVIVGADGKRVETLTDLSRILQNKKKVEKLALEIIRDRKKMELEIEVSGSILEEGRD
nr:PDZ domain-containing protein [Candidatus Saccharicenans sp.]